MTHAPDWQELTVPTLTAPSRQGTPSLRSPRALPLRPQLGARAGRKSAQLDHAHALGPKQSLPGVCLCPAERHAAHRLQDELS